MTPDRPTEEMRKTMRKLFAVLLLAPAIASQAHASPIGDGWHKQGVVKLSVLVKDFVPNQWTLEWRSKTDPTIDTDMFWRSGGLRNLDRMEGNKQIVFSVLHDSATGGLSPLLDTCWDDNRRVVIVGDDASNIANCTPYP